MTLDEKTFVIHQLAARLQDNQNQRLTSALINGIINEMVAVIPCDPPATAPSLADLPQAPES